MVGWDSEGETACVIAHFLSTSAGALVVAVVASAVVGFIVWWAVALTITLVALALWRLRERLGRTAARDSMF